MKCAFLLMILFFQPLQAEPWGKDATLVTAKTCQTSSTSKCETPVFGRFAESMIHFHQTVISPADGPRSHFLPSSSQYTLDAMRKYGFFQGFIMGCDRLMRENQEPWVYRKKCNVVGMIFKYDPVP